MEKFSRFSDRVSAIAGACSAILFILALIIITIEMFLRGVFSKTLYITDEYSGYLMAAMSYLALSYTLKEKGHIRVTILHTLLKDKQRIILDIFAFVVGFVICSVMTVTTFQLFWDSLVSGSRSMQISSTYMAIPHFFMPLGSFMLTIQFAAEACRSIVMLRTGQTSQIESSSLGR